MICLIASSFYKADKWAKSQNLSQSEWFYAADESDLLSKNNFHVIVTDFEFDKYQSQWFERIYSLAKQRGAIDRVW